MQDLTITLLQTALIWQDPSANRKALAATLATEVDQTDVVVLPEMFTTGFSMEAAVVAEPTQGPTLEWMHQQARQYEALIVGSIIAEEAGNYFNRLLAVAPEEGLVGTYDKRHLFRMANEHHTYTPGREHLVLNWKGWRIMPQICYDLRFPVWNRNRFSADVPGYDLAIYIANWPAARRQHWMRLLRARAIENLAYTVGVNRVGEDANGIAYSGDSMVLDTHGDTIVHLSKQPAVIESKLQAEALQRARDKFPAWQDADAFAIHRTDNPT